MINDYSTTHKLVATNLKARIVPLILGRPGEGKSDLSRKIATEFNLKYVDIRLSYLEPQELLGFPKIDGKKGTYLPMDIFPLESDPIPDGYAGWLINFDELTSAHPQVQAAAYRIILDREVGQHKLHPRCLLMGCGNRIEDNAIVEEMSTALVSRLAIYELELKLEEWLAWAQTNNLDWRILAYLNYMPARFNTFDPDSRKPYACARTWHAASRQLEKEPDASFRMALLAGVLGDGLAAEFESFIEVCASLPKLDDILNNPANAYIPKEASQKYAVCGMLVSKVTDGTFNALLQYMERFPVELQAMFFRQVCTAMPSVRSKPAFLNWAKNLGKHLV